MDILLLSIAFFSISMVGVSTGGLSLVTVPLLILVGLTPHQAVATNMFALIFMSLSGTAGFASEVKKTPLSLIAKLSVLTAIASFAGAGIVLAVDETVLRSVIAIVVLAVTVLVFLNRGLGLAERPAAPGRKTAGWIAVFILGIYGGFFSGAYITILTYIFILLWGMSFMRAAGLTKVLNVFSSAAACVYFIHSGAVNFTYAAPLSAAMFAGGYVGARIAVLKGNLWLRNIFLTAAAAMSLLLLSGQF